jgi:HEAT repeat protein
MIGADFAFRLRIAAVALLGAMAASSAAQGPSPRLAQLLGKLPADSPAIAEELLGLNAEDVRTLCDMLAEPGTGDDSKARFALHGLALVVAEPGRQAEREFFIRTLGEALRSDPPPKDGVFLIEQLGVTGDVMARMALIRGLMEDRWCEAAARALVAIGGEEATAALRLSLARMKGHCRVAVIQALGTLGDTQSVGTLLKDAASSDRDLRLAALYALARSGDPAATSTLVKATETDSWYERSQATDLLLTLASRMAEMKHLEPAAKIYRDLLQTRQSPSDTHVRCAALYGLATSLGRNALGDVLAALADQNPQVRAAAANIAVGLPGQPATEACIAEFKKTTPAGRITILDVLARRGDQAGLATVFDAFGDEHPPVRLAAIPAAATLGGERAVGPLVAVLASQLAEEVNAAREALIRIPGTHATEVIQTMLPGSPPPVRAALLDVLAARPPTGSLEPIFSAAADADPTVRVAALRALGALAAEREVPALLKLLVKADREEERSAAEKALAAVCRRCDDRERPAGLIVAALKGASTAVRCSLLRALGQVGGKQALETVLAALSDEQPDVKEAVFRAFSDWPDAQPAPQVLKLARDSTDIEHHVVSLRAYIRMIELDPGRPAADTLQMCAAALEAARRPDEKKLVLARLGQVHDAESLKMLEPYLKDQALGPEAAAAMIGIVETFIPGRWSLARKPLEALLAAAPPPDIRQRAEAALRDLERFEDHITDWWVAGPYEQAGKSGEELFDIAFPPEQPEAQGIEWHKHPPGSDSDSGWMVNLQTTIGGDHRAVYLSTRVYSPQTQTVRLEVGSDDRIKVWLNDRLVHAKAVHRGLAPAEDQIEVTLNQGWNKLLLKVVNDDGGWAACARFRRPDGSRLEGVYAQAGDKP